jgi:hypothetical protein
MKYHNVFLNVSVSVLVKDIQADNIDEAARVALNVVTVEQLTHMFDRKIDDRVETFYADEIPAIMIDQYKSASAPGETDEPVLTEWRRVDIPSGDMDVFAAIEDVLRVYGEGENPFANEDLKGKMAALSKAYAALPPHRTFVVPVSSDEGGAS